MAAIPETNLVLDNYALQVSGDLDLVSTGSDTQVTLQASGSGSAIRVEADDQVILTALGAAVVTVDSGRKQATVQGLESVKIGVGPPLEMGAVIDLTPTGISLTLGKQVVSITMSLLTGVEIKAAETSLKVGPAGITMSGPLLQESAEAAHKMSTTLEQQQASATRQFQAGVDMVG